MNLKKIIREVLESGNPLDWMMGGPKFDPNEILQKNKEKKVVALWIGDMDEYLSDFFNDFVKKNNYQYGDFVPKNLSKGNVKGLTFYPNGSVGFFRGRKSWDGYLNGVYGHHYVDVNPSNIHVIDLSDTNLREQISRMKSMMGVINENIPQPGISSGKPISDEEKEGMEKHTEQLTVNELIGMLGYIPYYKEVLQDVQNDDYRWDVTKKVMEYAEYLKNNPNTIYDLPPIIVVNGKLQDGAHRISTLYLLQNHLDSNNPLWYDTKLNVEFYS